MSKAKSTMRHEDMPSYQTPAAIQARAEARRRFDSKVGALHQESAEARVNRLHAELSAAIEKMTGRKTEFLADPTSGLWTVATKT